MSLKNLLALSLAFILSTTVVADVPKTDSKDTEIESAFEDPVTGRLIIRFKFQDGMLNKDKANPDFFGNNFTFYGTEKNFFQLESDMSGPIDRFKMSFADDRVKRSAGDTGGDFYAGVDPDDTSKNSTNYTLVCGDKSRTVKYKRLSKERIAKLQEAIRAGKAPLNSLPTEDRKPQYVFKRADGTIIYVDAPKYNFSRKSLRLFVGKPGAMKEKKVISVDFRRGGTIFIKTEDGETLFFPGANDFKTPTWNGAGVESLDAQGFDAASLEIKGVPSQASELHTPCDKFFPIKTLSAPSANGDRGADKPKGSDEAKGAR